MKYPIYKSLDKTSSLFGIKGSYLSWAISGWVIAGAVAFLSSKFVGGLIAFVLFVIAAAAVYVGIISFQTKFTERERTKWLASRKLPDFIAYPPKALRTYIGSKKCTAIIGNKNTDL